jgi:phosphoserine phosphatase
MSAKFASVVLDVDSTLSGIEGIDWLAERRGGDVAERIARLTDDAMRGRIPLEAVYGARLDVIKPTRADVEALGQVYIEQVAPGGREALDRLRRAGVRVVLVSGGLRQAILPLATFVGCSGAELSAVDVRFDEHGEYVSFDAASPLTTSEGKRGVVEAMALPRPIFAMGDGATDVAMVPVVDRFAAYVGFARRENVVAQADVVVNSFAELTALVLGG